MSHRRITIALFACFLVLAILLNSVGAVVLHAQRTFGVPESQAALIAVCKSGGILAASLIAAVWVARIGYRHTMLWALAGLAIACLLMPLASSFRAFELLFVICGAGFAAIKVAVYGSVGLIARTPREHASLLSLLEAFFTLGVVAGSLLFGLFTEIAPTAPGSWLRVFYVLALLGSVAWALVLIAPLDEARAHGTPRSWRVELPDAFRRTMQGVVLVFGGCVVLYVMLEQSTMNWLPTFNARVLNFSPRHSIQLAALLTLSMTAGRMAAAVVLRRAHWFPVLSMCLAASAALVVAGLWLTRETSAPGTLGWAARGFAVFVFPLVGFFIGPIYPVINSAILASLPPARHGAVASFGVLCSACGSSTGSWLLGYLIEAYGARWTLYFALVPLMGLMVFLGCFHRRTREAADGGDLSPVPLET